MTNLEIAKKVIFAYLGRYCEAANIVEMAAIKEDNNILKEHIKTLKSIFEKALKEMEEYKCLKKI